MSSSLQNVSSNVGKKIHNFTQTSLKARVISFFCCQVYQLLSISPVNKVKMFNRSFLFKATRRKEKLVSVSKQNSVTRTILIWYLRRSPGEFYSIGFVIDWFVLILVEAFLYDLIVLHAIIRHFDWFQKKFSSKYF